MPADAGKGGPKHSEYGHIFQCARLNENKRFFYCCAQTWAFVVCKYREEKFFESQQ